jgi:hypothetical protein
MRCRQRAGRRAWGRTAHNPERRAVDDTDQMDHIELLSDADLAQLVSGEVPPGRDDLVALSTALGALRARADAHPTPEMSPGLRIRLAEADTDVTARGRAGRLAVAPAAAPVSRQPRWRGAVGASAAALVLVAGVGVGAAQNALPTVVQDAIAASANLVGIDLPRSQDRHAPPAATPGGADPARPGSAREPAARAVPPAHGRDGQTGASTRDGSPSGDAPGQTDHAPSDGARGPDRGVDPGTVTAPEITDDRGGPPRGDEPTGPDRSGADDGRSGEPGDVPILAPGSGDDGATPEAPGGGGSTPGGPGGGDPGGGGSGGDGPGGGGQSSPSGPPQSGGGGQGGPTPMSAEGSASAAASAAGR